jgi:hypothetical protein
MSDLDLPALEDIQFNLYSHLFSAGDTMPTYLINFTISGNTESIDVVPDFFM